MPTKQKPPPDVDKLRAEAADLTARAGTIAADLQRLDVEQYDRQQQAQRQFDERAAASFSRVRLDDELDKARRTFEDALAADPLITVIADYLYARLHHHHAVQDQVSTLGRLGRDMTSAPYQPPPELGRLEDLLARAVYRVADARVQTELADLQHRRETAGTTATEEKP